MPLDAATIVVSLEWANKLKKAGWPQEESVLAWRWKKNHFGVFPASKNAKVLDAPTAEEILRRIPQGFDMEVEGKMRTVFITLGYHYCGIAYNDYDSIDGARQEAVVESIFADSLANAAAAMYCHLAEKDLLPV